LFSSDTFVFIEEIIVKEFGVTIFTVEEMNALKDPQDIPVGRGLMRANNSKTPELPFSAERVIDLSVECGNRYCTVPLPSTLSQRHDIHTWDRLGTAISYSGAGTMRNGQLASISLIKTSEGARRSLRLFRGLTCVGYNAVKQVFYVTYCVIDSHTILCDIART
jgi:hypothetical protein